MDGEIGHASIGGIGLASVDVGQLERIHRGHISPATIEGGSKRSGTRFDLAKEHGGRDGDEREELHLGSLARVK